MHLPKRMFNETIGGILDSMSFKLNGFDVPFYNKDKILEYLKIDIEFALEEIYIAGYEDCQAENGYDDPEEKDDIQYDKGFLEGYKAAEAALKNQYDRLQSIHKEVLRREVLDAASQI